MASNTTLVRAYGLITSTKAVVEDDSITVGTVTYVFKDAPDAANEVDVGADEATCLANLVAAINGTGISGTTYGADTLQPGGIFAVSDGAHVITLYAKTPGTQGNNFILTEVVDSGTAYAVTAFAHGSGDLETALLGLLSLNQINAEMLTELHKITYATD